MLEAAAAQAGARARERTTIYYFQSSAMLYKSAIGWSCRDTVNH